MPKTATFHIMRQKVDVLESCTEVINRTTSTKGAPVVNRSANNREKRRYSRMSQGGPRARITPALQYNTEKGIRRNDLENKSKYMTTKTPQNYYRAHKDAATTSEIPGDKYKSDER